MAQKEILSPREFVDEKNQQAPFAALSKTIGVDSTIRSQGIRSTVSTGVSDVLEGTELSDDDKMTLHELLMVEIAPFLKTQKANSLSMIDLVTLGLVDNESVKAFFRCRGIDLTDERHFAYVKTVLSEAVSFYNSHIIKSKKHRVNPEISKFRTPEDVYRLFKTASGVEKFVSVPAACGILRIAAAIDHMERDPQANVLPIVKAHLEKLVSTYFKKEQSGKRKNLVFRSGVIGDIDIPIYRIELRQKDRPRVIAKLLRKPEQRTEQMLDRVGLRFTTKSALNTLKLVYHIFCRSQSAIFPVDKVMIGHSKNLLLDEDTIRAVLNDNRRAKRLFSSIAVDTFDDDNFLMDDDDDSDNDNPFSSSKYRGINVPFMLPLLDEDGYFIEFPIELQFTDIYSKKETDIHAPHCTYVEDQMKAVRRRVGKNNLRTEYESYLSKARGHSS